MDNGHGERRLAIIAVAAVLAVAIVAVAAVAIFTDRNLAPATGLVALGVSALVLLAGVRSRY